MNVQVTISIRVVADRPYTAVPEELKQLIVMHLEELGKSFDGYFPGKDFQQYPAWVGQPSFSFYITTANVKDP